MIDLLMTVVYCRVMHALLLSCLWTVLSKCLLSLTCRQSQTSTAPLSNCCNADTGRLAGTWQMHHHTSAPNRRKAHISWQNAEQHHHKAALRGPQAGITQTGLPLNIPQQHNSKLNKGSFSLCNLITTANLWHAQRPTDIQLGQVE